MISSSYFAMTIAELPSVRPVLSFDGQDAGPENGKRKLEPDNELRGRT